MKSIDNTLSRGHGDTEVADLAVGHAALVLTLEASRPLAPPSRHSLRDLDAVVIGRAASRRIERRTEGRATTLSILVPDPWMSSTHARIRKVLGRWTVRDENSKNGTLVNGTRTAGAVLADGDVVEIGRTFFVFRETCAFESRPPDLEAAALSPPTPQLATFVGSLAEKFRMLEQVARTPMSILIRGETGTGKEVIARAVHQLGGRTGLFLPVNCAALPENLVEAELFGYRKGAFSGATEDRPGLVRTAEGGTLFLDEIGDLRESSQAVILRLLQESEVLPLGATRPIHVDVHVVAATHKNLEDLVARGRFRKDLLARLAGHELVLPTLRERREDLGLLVGALLQRIAADPTNEITFTTRAGRALLLHDWPYNIRELEQCLQNAVALAGAGPIKPEHLSERLRTALDNGPQRPKPKVRGAPAAEPLAGEDAQLREDLLALLTDHQGNITAVARAMGKERVQIRRWVKRFGLDPKAFRRPSST